MRTALLEQSGTVDRLGLDGLRLALFGGKGGVGKTTAATASALHFARSHPQKRVLLLSTDPAHSLADVIGQPIGAYTVPIFGLPNAWACELDACGLFRTLQDEAQSALQVILEGGTYLSREEVQQLLGLTIPGLDELMALFKVAQLLEEGSYDLLVLDTAPTGHTLRLLKTPSWVESMLQALQLMDTKRREIAGRLSRRPEQEIPGRILDEWQVHLQTIQEILSDPLRTGCYLITLGDELSLNETERLARELVILQLGIRALIANRLLLDASCGVCGHLAGLQQQVLATLVQRLPGPPIFVCPWLDGELEGTEALEQWYLSLRSYDPASARIIEREMPSLTWLPASTPPKLPDFIALGRRLLIFGGKGGVGKTTMAAVTARHLARHHPTRKVLLASIDPAHSLADCLERPVGPDPVLISPNLWAVEPDAESLFGEFQHTFFREIDNAWKRLVEAQRISPAYDREIFEHLLALSPPGTDEILAIARVADFQQQGNFDLIVLDAPPTGHMVRFLELPGLIGSWTHVLLRWLLHFQTASDLEKTISSLLKLARSARDLRRRLVDPGSTELIIVATAEMPVVEETCRLAGTLGRLGVACRHVVANMLMGDHGCATCNSLHQRQEQALAGLAHRLARYVLVQAPLCLQASPQANLNGLEEVLYG